MTRLHSYTLFFAVFSFLTKAAPSCDPDSICYSPSETLKIKIRNLRLSHILQVKIWSQNDETLDLYLYQLDGKEMKINKKLNCSLENEGIALSNRVEDSIIMNARTNRGFGCITNVSISNFDKKYPLFVRTGSTPVSDGVKLDTRIRSEGLSHEQRRKFTKAHAVLMLLGWMFFVPTGFLFARLGRDLFKGQALFGTAVWFQIHRASSFIGVVCICSSILCIFIAQEWTWKGTGSDSWYWTKVHTYVGIISTVLAVAQPLNSLLRCGPTDSKRIIFNWAHRIIGILSFTLAMTANIIAAIHFERTWDKPLLEVFLLCLPILLCVAATIGFPILESNRFRKETIDRPHLLRIPVVFWAIGVFFASAVALSLLVIN